MTENGPVPVMHFIGSLEAGGAQRQLYYTLSGLQSTRFRCTLLLQQEGGIFFDSVRNLGIPIEILEPGFSFYNPASVRQLIRLLRKKRPAILHNWIFRTNAIGAIGGSLAGVPVIISSIRNVSQMMVIEGARFWEREIIRLSTGLNDGIIAVSDLVAQDYACWSGCDRKNITIIRNALDLSHYDPAIFNSELRDELGLSQEAPIVGFLGRLSPEKDVPTLLKAAEIVIKSMPQTIFLIAGNSIDHAYSAGLREKAKQLGIERNIFWINERPEVASLLATVDVFALTSIAEGMPNALLEAMAMAKPCVATRVGGNPEIVEDGVTGFLIPPSEPAECAIRILALLKDEKLRTTMGAAGRRKIQQQFAISGSVKSVIELYERLLR